MEKDKDFIIDALNSYWHEANRKLESKDCGDIERKNYEHQLSKSEELIKYFNQSSASDMKGELKAFWTDELVLEFAVRSHLGKGREMTIEEFKKMKLTKPQ